MQNKFPTCLTKRYVKANDFQIYFKPDPFMCAIREIAMGKDVKQRLHKFCEFPHDSHILKMTLFQKMQVLKGSPFRSKSPI
jgi:hypothetical protein